MLKELKKGSKTFLLGLLFFAFEQLMIVLIQVSLSENASAIKRTETLLLTLLSIYGLYRLAVRMGGLKFPKLTLSRKKIISIIMGTPLLIAVASNVYFIVGTRILKSLGIGWDNSMVSQNQQVLLENLSSSQAIPFYILTTVIVAPCLEEFTFRYLIMNKQTKILTRNVRTVISLLLFAGVHVFEEFSLVNSPTTLAIALFHFGQYLIISAFLVYIFNSHQDLRINIVVHSIWNGLCLLTIL